MQYAGVLQRRAARAPWRRPQRSHRSQPELRPAPGVPGVASGFLMWLCFITEDAGGGGKGGGGGGRSWGTAAAVRAAPNAALLKVSQEAATAL